jgi:hypothetical protein
MPEERATPGRAGLATQGRNALAAGGEMADFLDYRETYRGQEASIRQVRLSVRRDRSRGSRDSAGRCDFTPSTPRSHRGLWPQPKDVLTQRHEATKRTAEVRGPPQLRGFAALCENHASRATFCEIVVQRQMGEGWYA